MDYANESFIDFCDDMMIANEGFLESLKQKVKNLLLKIIRKLKEWLSRGKDNKVKAKLRSLLSRAERALTKTERAKTEEDVQEVQHEAEDIKEEMKDAADKQSEKLRTQKESSLKNIKNRHDEAGKIMRSSLDKIFDESTPTETKNSKVLKKINDDLDEPTIKHKKEVLAIEDKTKQVRIDKIVHRTKRLCEILRKYDEEVKRIDESFDREYYDNGESPSREAYKKYKSKIREVARKMDKVEIMVKDYLHELRQLGIKPGNDTYDELFAMFKDSTVNKYAK